MRLGPALLVAGLCAGCIEPQLQTCGDLLCATDSICVEDRVCAARESVEACSGLVDKAPCATALFDGTCVSGVCTSARCGDGIVSGAEQCDGPVTNTDCVEFGFDMGVPACNDRCDLDLISSCTRFGWRRILAEPIEAMWADGATGLAFIRTIDDTVEVRWGNTSFVEPGVWSELAGNATTVFAVRDNRAIKSAGGAWEDVASPNAGAVVRHAVVTDDGTLCIAYGQNCTIAKLAPGGTWSEIEPGAGSCGSFAASGNSVLVGYEDGNIRRYNGGWSTVTFTGDPVSAVAELAGNVWYCISNLDGVYIIESGNTFTVHADACDQLVRAGDYLFAHNGDGAYRRVDDTDLIERMSAPTFGEMYASSSGRFYVYGNGINMLTDFAYAEHDGVDGVTLDMTMTVEGLPVVSTPTNVYGINGNDYWDELNAATNVIAVAGAYTDELYMSTGTIIEFFDGGGVTDLTPPAFVGGLNDLWAPPVGDAVDVYAVGDNALLMSYVAGDGWTTHTPPANPNGCNLAALAGDGTSLYAVGACGSTGVVWKLGTGTTWTEAYRGGLPLAAVTIASDGEVFAAGSDGGSRTVNGVWQEDKGAQGHSISATTSTDVWCGGGPGEVVRWNGTEWSRVAVTGAIEPRVIATPTAVYFAGTSQSVLIR